jgi:catechol 2,3-dioxygenase-like lactoylglutathione lyase family enzyme
MIFRFARHTNDLERIKSFYIDVLGFELLGSFENHEGYDGIFIGKPTLDWHLEFTKSNENVYHSFDEDDLLVFYPESISEYENLINRIAKNNIHFITPKNPYWKLNGKMIMDPDGYNIILSNLKT